MPRIDSDTVEGVVDLVDRVGTGPLWGMASPDLNATLLVWPPDHAVDEHVNEELDVLVIVLEGDGKATIDAQTHELRAGTGILIPRGTQRRIEVGPNGIRYLSVHRRRGPLQLERSPKS